MIKDPVLKDLAAHQTWVDEEAERDEFLQQTVEDLLEDDDNDMSEREAWKEAIRIDRERTEEYNDELRIIRRFGHLPDF